MTKATSVLSYVNIKITRRNASCNRSHYSHSRLFIQVKHLRHYFYTTPLQWHIMSIPANGTRKVQSYLQCIHLRRILFKLGKVQACKELSKLTSHAIISRKPFCCPCGMMKLRDFTASDCMHP